MLKLVGYLILEVVVMFPPLQQRLNKCHHAVPITTVAPSAARGKRMRECGLYNVNKGLCHANLEVQVYWVGETSWIRLLSLESLS